MNSATNVLTFAVEKGIVMPSARNSGGTNPFSAALKTALWAMDIGDSFAYEDATKSGSAATKIRNLAKRAGIKVSIHKVGDRQYRCWRIA